jgi:hypothetical protein
VKNRFLASGDTAGNRSISLELMGSLKLTESAQLPSGCQKHTDRSPWSDSGSPRVEQKIRPNSLGAIWSVQLRALSRALMLGGSNSGFAYSPLISPARKIPRLTHIKEVLSLGDISGAVHPSPIRRVVMWKSSHFSSSFRIGHQNTSLPSEENLGASRSLSSVETIPRQKPPKCLPAGTGRDSLLLDPCFLEHSVLVFL